MYDAFIPNEYDPYYNPDFKAIVIEGANCKGLASVSAGVIHTISGTVPSSRRKSFDGVLRKRESDEAKKARLLAEAQAEEARLRAEEQEKQKQERVGAEQEWETMYDSYQPVLDEWQSLQQRRASAFMKAWKEAKVALGINWCVLLMTPDEREDTGDCIMDEEMASEWRSPVYHKARELYDEPLCGGHAPGLYWTGATRYISAFVCQEEPNVPEHVFNYFLDNCGQDCRSYYFGHVEDYIGLE